MSPALSALLCLGPLPRPSLRAENGSLSPLGRRVTFRCRGSQGAAEYLLEKDLGRELKPITYMKSEEAEVEFSIPRMTLNDTGNYCCRYRTASLWSERSDPLELVVTELDHPPSLSAWPGSTVAEGQNVSLQCRSEKGYDRSALYKDGEQVTQASAQPHGRGSQANVSIPAVTSAHGGTYRCYSFQSHAPHEWSFPSDPLELRVTGISKDPPLPHSPGDTQALTASPPNTLPRPSLRAEPGLVVPQGKPVTLWCKGPPGAGVYHLTNRGSNIFVEAFPAGLEAWFTIPEMAANTAGSYQCVYYYQSRWSEPSEPLELRVSGLFPPPSLSAWPSSTVAPGQDVTLRCHSQEFFDRSALYKDGAPVTQASAQPHGRGSLANVSIPAVTSAHGGMYRCYSFQSHAPHEWSAPSDPLELRVTDPAAQDYTVGNVIRLSLAGLVLILLGVCWLKSGIAAGDAQGELLHLLTQGKAELGGTEGADPKDSQSSAHTQRKGPAFGGSAPISSFGGECPHHPHQGYGRSNPPEPPPALLGHPGSGGPKPTLTSSRTPASPHDLSQIRTRLPSDGPAHKHSLPPSSPHVCCLQLQTRLPEVHKKSFAPLGCFN